MRIFAISDLHISTNTNKPMDVFGGNWVGYLDNIFADWDDKITDDDLVLIGGDTSWAINLEDAVKDFELIAKKRGKKVFIRGNHDYWWNGIGKVRKALPDNCFALQNDCIKFGNVIICGSRGWSVPGSTDFDKEDEKIYLREIERLKLSFGQVKRIREPQDKLIVLIHFPPFNGRKEPSAFTEMFQENGVDAVVFGHIHGKSPYKTITEIDDIKYYLTACDQVDNKFTEIIL